MRVALKSLAIPLSSFSFSVVAVAVLQKSRLSLDTVRTDGVYKTMIWSVEEWRKRRRRGCETRYSHFHEKAVRFFPPPPFNAVTHALFAATNPLLNAKGER